MSASNQKLTTWPRKNGCPSLPRLTSSGGCTESFTEMPLNQCFASEDLNASSSWNQANGALVPKMMSPWGGIYHLQASRSANSCTTSPIATESMVGGGHGDDASGLPHPIDSVAIGE